MPYRCLGKPPSPENLLFSFSLDVTLPLDETGFCNRLKYLSRLSVKVTRPVSLLEGNVYRLLILYT